MSFAISNYLPSKYTVLNCLEKVSQAAGLACALVAIDSVSGAQIVTSRLFSRNTDGLIYGVSGLLSMGVSLLCSDARLLDLLRQINFLQTQLIARKDQRIDQLQQRLGDVQERVQQLEEQH
jgi:hypothetical protein